MELSKMIPARKHTLRFKWVKRDFQKMSDNYREIRKKTGRGMMDTCKWCGYSFDNGDPIALAAPEKGMNVVLCDSCAVKAGG